MDDTILRPSKVAEILAVSKPFVYQLISRGELASLKLGRVRRVRRSDLDLFISNHISKANDKSWSQSEDLNHE